MYRYEGRLLRFLRQRGASADAEDLAQDTFVRVYVNLHCYQPRWRFSTWLFTIARRLSINHHWRSSRSMPTVPLSGWLCPRNPAPPSWQPKPTIDSTCGVWRRVCFRRRK